MNPPHTTLRTIEAVLNLFSEQSMSRRVLLSRLITSGMATALSACVSSTKQRDMRQGEFSEGSTIDQPSAIPPKEDEAKQLPMSVLNTFNQPPYLVFAGPSISGFFEWKLHPAFGGTVAPGLWETFNHSCSIFPILAIKYFFEGYQLPILHAGAHLLNPNARAVGAIDARSGAKNSSLATPLEQIPGTVQGPLPSNPEIDAKGKERIERILKLFSDEEAMGGKEETLRKAKQGSFDGRDEVLVPDVNEGHTLVVTTRSSSRVPLYCSYNIESSMLGYVNPPTELIYVGRKSNWVQVIVPQFRSREDSGYRWVDARNLGVGLGNGKLARLYVNHKSRDFRDTWDGTCHTDKTYVCAS